MTDTSDLIRRIAAEGALPHGRRLGPRLMRGVGLGLAAAGALSVFALGLRPDLAAALTLPPLTAKLLTAALVAWAALAAMERLARPGAKLLEIGLILPTTLATAALVALCLIARPETANAADPLRCAASIVALAAPALYALTAALRGGGATRPAATGAAAGLGAGALGALGFALHCPIDHGPTVALWYGGAMLCVAGLGALIGARMLRW